MADEKPVPGNGQPNVPDDTEEESDTPSLAQPSAPSGAGDFQMEGELPGLVKLMTPEIVILIWAIIIDISNIVVVCFGLDDFCLIDIIGMCTISLWSVVRSQTFVTPQKLQSKGQNFVRKLFTGKWGKFLTPIVGEVIPYVGVGPWWSLAVYYQLTA